MPTPKSPATPTATASTGKPDTVVTPATGQPDPQPSRAPFIVERSATYRLGSVPVSGHYTLDFDTAGGRQYARDLAHDLLLQAEDREAVVADENEKRIDRITAILVATTESDPETAREQAIALLDAGMEFKK